MKYSVLSALLVVLAFMSCNKSSDDATPSNNNGNNNTPINNNPKPQQNVWSWSGTPPFSAKIDGKNFQLDTTSTSVYSEAFGYINLNFNDVGKYNIGLSFQTNVQVDSEYSIPSPANISYTYDHIDSGWQLGGFEGKYKILTMTKDSIEGKFYGKVKDYTNRTNQMKSVTEGYFKVERK